jgi:ATP-dependent exoDNAse (exonuclease V) beta subunit
VAELLKRAIDRTDYRAFLATSDIRRARNLDKLLADAHDDGRTRVRAFLEHIQALQAIGARVGEAPAEAHDAVRLMTIHKAKGLEFAVVVLADAARRLGHHSAAAYLTPDLGLAVAPDRIGAAPLATRIACWIDSRRADAEEQRLLYVAATRAQEKLLISGHIVRSAQGWSSDGWMQRLAEVARVDLGAATGAPGGYSTVMLLCGEPVGLWVASGEPGR